MTNTYYAQSIRKLIVGFGDLFNNITIVRYNADGTEQERFLVPIQYAPKEDYIQRIQADPDLEKKVRITLPRMSFENTGMSYDTSRKLNTNIQNFNQSGSTLLSQYNPVPYDFDFSLYIYVRNITDATQIIEHILPFFTPDYTIKLNMVPEMGIIKEIPVVLKSVTSNIDYEGSRDRETRLIIWTLDFNVKGYIFGQISNSRPITSSITNIFTDTAGTNIQFTLVAGGVGKYKIGETVYQGYDIGTATATATVISHINNILTLNNISGNFNSSSPIIGLTTNANWHFSSYNLNQQKQVSSNTIPNPITANGTSPYIANTITIHYNQL